MENSGGGSQNGPARRLTGESLAVFREGLYLAFSKWQALQLGIQNESAGRKTGAKADEFRSKIFDLFAQSTEPLDKFVVEELLDEEMDSSLNIIVDDGSLPEVALNLVTMHKECLDGNYNSVEILKNLVPAAGAAHRHVRLADDEEEEEENDDSEEDDIDMMMVDAPRPVVSSDTVNGSVAARTIVNAHHQAEDGWEIVSSRRNRSKRN